MTRKLLLLTLLFTVSKLGFSQLTNISFEDWKTDTSTLDLTTLGLPKDTFSFQDPIGWTSSNYVTGADSLGSRILVTQSNDAYHLASSVEIHTDTVRAKGGGINLPLTVPGFVISGEFKISLNSFLGTTFSPTNVKGAGVPITSRKEKVAGYLKYAPVAGDSCGVLAFLKKGSVLVAQATYFRKSNDASFTYFEAPFEYLTCDLPDTAIILICSSNPYSLANVVSISGTGLTPGSVLKADSIFMTDLAAAPINPIAVTDYVYTPMNTAIAIDVKGNDQDCNSPALTLSVPSVNPTSVKGGTNTLASNMVTYTPATSYIGNDTFFYGLSNGSRSSTGMVVMTIGNTAVENTTSAIKAVVYPNPTSDKLMIKTESTEAAYAVIYDLTGREILKTDISANQVISVSTVTNGIYTLSLRNNQMQSLYSSRIVIQK